MIRQHKLIFIKWFFIGFIALFLISLVSLIVMGIDAKIDIDRMESRRSLLLYETNHEAILKTCRELSMKLASGLLKPGIYLPDDKKDIKEIPKSILNLHPIRVDIERDGRVDIIMSPIIMYGLCAFPENYKGSTKDKFTFDEHRLAIELVPGLWYYDEDFQRHPENMKVVEEKLKAH